MVWVMIKFLDILYLLIYFQPEVLAYRNKDEFGIHFGVDGNPKTVGFFVGRPTDPLMTCVPATFLINMRDSHKQIAQVINH